MKNKNTAVETTNVEVPAELVNVTENSVEIVEVVEAAPESVESLTAKMNRLKAEQAAKLAELNAQVKELAEKAKQMKAEEAAMKIQAKELAAQERFAKLQEKLVRPEDTKRNAIINAILGTKDASGNFIIAPATSMEEVVLITGFDSKLVSDTVWGLEKAVGLR